MRKRDDEGGRQGGVSAVWTEGLLERGGGKKGRNNWRVSLLRAAERDADAQRLKSEEPRDLFVARLPS